MANTEKVTINVNVVDLGKIDLLVDEGFYSNRTDFIKTAVRNQLAGHSEIVNKVITDTSYNLGVQHYRRKELEKVLNEKRKLAITQVGLLSLGNDIDPDLALKTIESIKVYGVFKATAEMKAALKDRIK